MSKQLEAALKWLDAFDSCVYSGPAFAAEHARTIKAEVSRLTVERDPGVGHTAGDGKLREALEHIRDRVRGSNDTLKSDIDKIACIALSVRDAGEKS